MCSAASGCLSPDWNDTLNLARIFGCMLHTSFVTSTDAENSKISTKHNPAQNDTGQPVQHSTAQQRIVWYGTAQHDTAQRNMTQQYRLEHNTRQQYRLEHHTRQQYRLEHNRHQQEIAAAVQHRQIVCRRPVQQ